jgi:hypothetical protein
LEDYSDRGRNLLRQVHRFGDVEMHGDDPLHSDYNHENVLFDDQGQVTGVVDWAGSARRGDRRFALVKLRYLLAWELRDLALLTRLDELLETMIDPETLLVYWAHWGLRMVDRTIRTARPVDVELHLDVAASCIGKLRHLRAALPETSHRACRQGRSAAGAGAYLVRP